MRPQGRAAGIEHDLQPSPHFGQDVSFELLFVFSCDVHARSARQFVNQRVFGSVDDEGSAPGHHREIADVEFGLLNLFAFLQQTSGHSKRTGKG